MKYALTILLMFGLLSCGSEVVVEETPEYVMEQEELIDLIVDVQILESHYHNMFNRPNVYANALDSASQFIFEDHGVTKAVFESNIEYHTQKSDSSLYSIYEAALDTINNRINSNIFRQ